MNRRDFLLVRRQAREVVAELSCERLYMQFAEAQLMADQRREHAAEADPVPGEPPPVFDQPTVDQLFGGLAERLGGVDVVRIVDVQWLACAGFRERMQALCAAVQAKGARVENAVG
jgi:hypothetical protein